MSTRRYRWSGTSSSDIDNLVEAGAGATLDFQQRTPWTEITVADSTRDTDLDEFMEAQGYVFDPTGPVLLINSGPHVVGTEQAVFVDATAGPITVTVPLVSSRLGNDVLVQKVDATANAITVLRSGSDTIAGSATQTLSLQGDALRLSADGTTSDWRIAHSRRARDITFDSSGLPTLSADDVQEAISDILTFDLASIEVFTSGEALAAGDLLALDSSGDAVRASSSIGSANYEVIGVSNQTVGTGVPVQVITHTGTVRGVNFTSAPPASSNGSLVFLSTSPGQANTAPPGVGGNVIFTIGTLQGADGATTSPTVVFRPQLIAFRS